MRYPVLKQINARDRKVMREFCVQIPDLGIELIAHPGAVVNGASVPRALWWFASPWSGRYTTAAVFHDLLYATCKLPKLQSDFVFLDLMRQWKVGYMQRKLMYTAVVIGGSMKCSGKQEWLTMRHMA